MTHEYTVFLGGVILGTEPMAMPPTALASAAGVVLAVGDDATVRAISRGDSTFIDLDGRAVLPLSLALDRLPRVRAAIAAGEGPAAVRALLASALGDTSEPLVPGAAVDLAVLSADPTAEASERAGPLEIVATVRRGRWIDGPPSGGGVDG